MCGIAALLDFSLAPAEALQIVNEALGRIAHRGEPQFQHEDWSTTGFAGGANRLPFTSGSEAQPAHDASGRFQVFLNGELYSLHGRRDARGGKISDTRALAEEIANLGIVPALRGNHGMYAAIVIDADARCAYLARDPFGIKPLYYAITPYGVLVASELKGLAPFAFVDAIEHVAPGAILKIAGKQISLVGTIALAPDRHAAGLAPGEYARYLKNALLASVREQTRDSAQYGVYLSGGIDSSAVYALAKENGVEVFPFVLGTSDSSDVAAARDVANYFGDELKFIECPSELELARRVEDVVRVCESFEPNVVRQSAVSMVLAQGAKAFGCRAVLCGEGADELFGGYPEFWQPGVSFAEVRKRFLRDLHRTQLQRVDRVNMASTIEVRVPFLTPSVAGIALAKRAPLDFAEQPDGDQAKLPLRRALHGLLPNHILRRDKVVLSEGAGLRGNHPVDGMFSDILAGIGSRPQGNGLAQGMWKLKTDEERVYFNAFDQFGYSKYRPAQERVFANATATQLKSLFAAE